MPSSNDLVARAWHLVSRPEGSPVPGDFALRDIPLPPLKPGELLVRNDFFSVDPYMRRRMDGRATYVAPFTLGAPMDGRAVGTVVRSRHDGFAAGDHVVHSEGWRDYAVIDASSAGPVDTRSVPASAYLGFLGSAGLTAYAGLTRAARLQRGDTVFVSGAAGAVGTAVGQLAKLMGAARVIGSTGSAEKATTLTGQLGFDAVLNYRDQAIAAQLQQAAPDGIDVYFDNVGGDHLEAALESLRVHGRVVLCGMIGDYNSPAGSAAPRNLIQAIDKRLQLTGILVADHADLAAEFVDRGARWVAEGLINPQETIVDGLDNGARAFLDMLGGRNLGKMLVRVNA